MTELENRCARAICIAIGDDPDREGDERITAYDSAARAVLAEAGVAEMRQALVRISVMRPAGDVETAPFARKLVANMETVALQALAKIGANQ